MRLSLHLAACFFAVCVCVACAGGPMQNSASIGSGASATVGNSKAPSWVREPYSTFDRQIYVAAVGSAATREAAEKDALGKLAAIFGQSIRVDERVSAFYREVVVNGAVGWSESTGRDIIIATSAAMDSLIGAEIGEVWDSGRGNAYAVAVLNRTKALQTYSNLIRANQEIIDNLINLSPAEKNSLDGFARYQFAAAVADVNFSYGNLLTQIGAPFFAQGLKKGDEYRLEAQNITKTIPVGIEVKNDKSGRIKSAFAKAFSDLGFASGGNNSRYILQADASVSPVDFPNNKNKFARIELSANLTDAGTKTVLLPYSFNTREGHTTLAEAENRVYAAAEKKINEEYRGLLSDYLSRFIPKK